MVTYNLKGHIEDIMKEDFYTEHRKNIKQAIENQRLIINGESIENDENFVSSKKDDFPKP